MVYLTGYGFPSTVVAPCTTPAKSACSTWCKAMNRFAQNPMDDASAWAPALLLVKLAAEGKAFQ